MSGGEKLIAKKCLTCGFIQQEDHLRCLKCKNDTFDLIEAQGNCTLITYTILNAPPLEFRDKKSYTLGVIQFKNGIKALGQIEFNGDLKTGLKLTPIYKKICNNLDGKEIYGFIFKLVN
ncbi:MAG: Zn-ribbon domain-containing OB-fold protein [Promethearchaeota archaeon]